MQTTLTRISLSLNQFHTVCPKIGTKFLGKLGNSKVFSAQNKVVSKKKKKVFTEIESDFLAEIRNSKVFSAQIKVVLKKKKRSSPKLRLIFRPISQIQTFKGGCFPMGGAIFNFSQKIGLKSTKNMRFCILHKPMGKLEPPAPPPPPPPGYATDSNQNLTKKGLKIESFLQKTQKFFCVFFLRPPSKVTNFNPSPMPLFGKIFIRYIKLSVKKTGRPGRSETGQPAGQPAMILKFTGWVGSRKS